ncbi:Reticulophagy receptor [Liparis tanakae]|uniref:Reticulophagy receptor n=1 Tax=Liparis tanakae TaxID=230148 RepID=A0A4Z2FDB0_9TELE|nr:Reticulophagy receptor [Liparis tanakae]
MLGSREPGAAGCGEVATGPPGPPGRPLCREERPPGGAGCRPTGLVSWRQRPCRTLALFAAANAGICFVAFSSLRTFSLLVLLMALLVLMTTAGDFARSKSTGAHLWRSMTAR